LTKGVPNATIDDMNRLKEIRRAKGLSQQALAKRAGVHVSTIKRFEFEKVKCHNSVLKLIAQALEVDPSELVDDEIPPSK
jgi:transcriptional regulator with XRE-family HTH domain